MLDSFDVDTRSSGEEDPGVLNTEKERAAGDSELLE